jgi:hypothetical protein
MSVRPVEWYRKRCEEDGDCLLWIGSTDIRGVPRITLRIADKPTTVQVRREWWTLHRGEIPKGKTPMVTCGNPCCLEHMRLASKSEIMREASKRADYKSRRHVAGLKNRDGSSIDMDVARYVRSCGKTLRELSVEFDLSQSHLSRIRRGISWKEAANPFSQLMASNDSGRKAA